MRRRSLLLLGAVALLLAVVTLASGEPIGCYVDRETIYIYGDSDFCFANGVVAGCGSAENPYIIEGWRIAANHADDGIRIEQTTAHFIIRNCIVSGGAGAAIRLNTLSNGRVESCQLLRAERGLLLENVSRVAVFGNVISENRRGAVMDLGSWGNILSANSFVSSGKNGEDSRAENQWFWQGTGNYWSDYGGEDCNGDGIGDTAYEHVNDAFPLMSPPGSCPTLAIPAAVGACGIVAHTNDCGAVVGSPCYTAPAYAYQVSTPCAPTTVCTHTPACPGAFPCGPYVACPHTPACPTTVPCGASVTCNHTPICPSASPCGPAVSCGHAPACPTATVCAPATACNPCVTPCEDQVLTCIRTAVTLTADVAPGNSACAPCSIRWKNERGEIVGTERNIVVQEPGIYTITIAGADGCSVSDSVAVYQDIGSPIIQTSVAGVLTCNVTEVGLAALISGGRPPYTIAWSGPGGRALGCEEQLKASVPGTYTVTVTGANGCVSSATAIVTEEKSQPVIQATVDGTLTCANTAVTVSANVTSGQPPYSYVWSRPGVDLVGSSPSIVVGEAGTYTVTVRGANGCAGTATVSVTWDANPPSVSVSGSGVLTCSVTSVPLTASVAGGRPPYEVLWMLPGRGVIGEGLSHQATEPGTYTVTANGVNGCWASADIVVTQDIAEPDVDAGEEQMLTLQVREVTLTATTSNCPSCAIAWANPLGESAGSSASITVDKPGIYTATATNPTTGCVASDEVSVGSDRVSEVMLSSSIHDLAVFGQLLKDGVPIPGTAFSFHVGENVSPATGAELSSVTMMGGGAVGVDANGAEINYIIPTLATVRFTIHKEQFILGKQYWLLHLPTDPEGDAAISFY